MKIWDVRDEQGRLVGFEISSLVGHRSVRKLLERTRGASGVRARRLFERKWPFEDAFCLFDYEGAPYRVAEPFGDNSRYIIQPMKAADPENVAKLRDQFQSARAVLGIVLRT